MAVIARSTARAARVGNVRKRSGRTIGQGVKLRSLSILPDPPPPLPNAIGSDRYCKRWMVELSHGRFPLSRTFQEFFELLA